MSREAAMYTSGKINADGEIVRKGAAYLSKRDSVLRGLVKRVGPCQLRPQKKYFVALCEAIVAQQLAVKAAATIFGRFCDLFERGKPAPAALLELSEEELRGAGLSGQKLKYLRDLANKFEDKSIPQRRLTRMTDDEVVETLTQVKGIGEWTAQMFLIFVLHRQDVWPTEDLGLRRAVQINYNLDDLPDKAVMEELGVKWKPYRSVASWYLWQSLDNKPLS